MRRRCIHILVILGMVALKSPTAISFAQQPRESTVAAVTVPRLITLTGALSDRNGRPLSGITGIRFAMYKNSEGGIPVWAEIQNLQLNEQGRYSVLLGATQGGGLPIELFTASEPRWVGVHAQLPGEEEQPRFLLVSVPYALKAVDADTIAGKPVSAFVLAQPEGGKPATSSTGSSPISASADTIASEIAGTGGTNKLINTANGSGIFDCSSHPNDSNSFPSLGNVSIGACGHPLTLLHLVQTTQIRLAADGSNNRIEFWKDAADGLQTTPAAVGTFGLGSPLSGLTSDIVISTFNTSGWSDRLTVLNVNGNVGIGTLHPNAALQVASGDAYISNAGGGMILKSPDGTKCARISIDNNGALVTSALTCP